MTIDTGGAAKGVRIEWEVPPTRGIRSSWFEEDPAFTDQEWIDAFRLEHPLARVRKIERNIDIAEAASRIFHEGYDTEATP